MTATDPGTTIRETTIPVGVGLPGEEEVRSWLDCQIPYVNYAGHSESFDQTVRQFLEGVRTGFRRRMMTVYDRWKVNLYVANGNSVAQEYEDDIHVPETAKMLNMKAVRIEEALFEYDPFFVVEGVKDPIDQIKALIVGAYIRRELELAGFRDYVLPTIKDAELCQIAAVKVLWDRVLQDIVERNIEHEVNDKGQLVYRDKRVFKKQKLVREGASLEQVRPERILIDLDAGQVRRCSFIGDVSDQFLHTLQANAKTGLFAEKQVAKIKAHQPGRARTDGTEIWDQVSFARSITQPWGNRESQEQHHGARRIETTELWAWFDFKEGFDGVTGPDGKRLTGFHQVVITEAEGVLIQFRLNPFDKKFAPYGVAQLNKNGHSMIAVGPFDNTVMVNAQYDRFQSDILRHFGLSVVPIIGTEGESDLPDSVLGIRPGTVFRNVGKVHEFKTSDIPQSVAYMHSYFRRECEENSGALRFWDGVGEAGGGKTFGEIERRLQEANRTLRGEIRAVSDMWRQVGLIIYWMSGQFSTSDHRFQVLGKASQILDQYAEVTPDMLQDDIDLRFIGLDSLHTYGQKTTGMMQWLNMWGPRLPAHPEVSENELMQLTWEQMVGKDNTRRVFNVPTPKYLLMDQDQENVHLLRGRKVRVDQQDDDLTHLEKMQKAGLLELAKDKQTPNHVRNSILEHMETHRENYLRKREQRKADEAAAQQRASLLQTTDGAVPGEGKPAADGGMEASKQEGITPGPTQGRTVAKSGREGDGMSQGQVLQQVQ